MLENEKTALIFDSLKMDILYNKLDELILDENKRRIISESAYKKLMSDHTWEKNSEEIMLSSGVL